MAYKRRKEVTEKSIGPGTSKYAPYTKAKEVADLGYSRAKRDALSTAEESEVAGLGHEEKLLQCAHEFPALLPNRVPEGKEERAIQAEMEALGKRFGLPARIGAGRRTSSARP